MLGFNTTLKLTVRDLLETTQLPEKELIRQVQSLIESKLISVEDKGVASQPAADESETKPSTSVSLSFNSIHVVFFFKKSVFFSVKRAR
jgi:hypothetical protein